MASFDEIPFGDVRTGCGGLLFLAKPAGQSLVIATAAGVEVEVGAASRGIVIRGLPAAAASEVRGLVVEHANRALDLASVRGTTLPDLADPTDEHLIWWSDGSTTTARIWAATAMTASVGALKIEVRDAEGNIVPPTPSPLPTWHPSMRYFRRSQATTDLYDAFRNVYLALEALLSAIEPMPVKGNGKPGRGERAWFADSLARAGSMIALEQYVRAGAPTGAPVEALVDELYDTVRTSIFHAKGGLPVMLPQDEQHRTAVLDAKIRAARLYVDLAAAHLGIRYLSGGFSDYAFEQMLAGANNSMHIEVGDDPAPFDRDDTVLNPSGGAVVEIPAERAPELEGHLHAAVRAVFPATDLISALQCVARFGTASSDGRAAVVQSLEGALDVSGFDTVEFVVVLRAVQGSQPKSEYAS